MVGGDINSVAAVTRVSIQIKQEAFYFVCLFVAYALPTPAHLFTSECAVEELLLNYIVYRHNLWSGDCHSAKGVKG